MSTYVLQYPRPSVQSSACLLHTYLSGHHSILLGAMLTRLQKGEVLRPPLDTTTVGHPEALRTTHGDRGRHVASSSTHSTRRVPRPRLASAHSYLGPSRFLFRDTGLSSSDTGDTGPGRRLRARPCVAPPARIDAFFLPPAPHSPPRPPGPLTPARPHGQIAFTTYHYKAKAESRKDD